MSTSQDIVTRAYRRLGALDINSTPSAAMTSHGLAALNAMIDSWRSQGLAINVTRTGSTTSGGAIITTITSPATTVGLYVGMAVSGTGIASGIEILTVDTTTQITLTLAATATGTVALTFNALPLPSEFEDAITALLAVRLSPDVGVEPSAILMRDANSGWEALSAAYVNVPEASFDDMLASLSSNRNEAW